MADALDETIERNLLKCAEAILAEVDGRKAIPGWRALFEFKPNFVEVGHISLPTLDEDSANSLIELAHDNPHAFDAASYLAGVQIALGEGSAHFHLSLQDFAAEILMGDRIRPPQKGRPPAGRETLQLWQYFLCDMTAHPENGIVLSHNRERPSGARKSACEFVAEAFTQAGRHVTAAQLASLFYHEGYADFRKMAEVCGRVSSRSSR